MLFVPLTIIVQLSCAWVLDLTEFRNVVLLALITVLARTPIFLIDAVAGFRHYQFENTGVKQSS
jgi:hypothetical protein